MVGCRGDGENMVANADAMRGGGEGEEEKMMQKAAGGKRGWSKRRNVILRSCATKNPCLGSHTVGIVPV